MLSLVAFPILTSKWYYLVRTEILMVSLFSTLKYCSHQNTFWVTIWLSIFLEDLLILGETLPAVAFPGALSLIIKGPDKGATLVKFLASPYDAAQRTCILMRREMGDIGQGQSGCGKRKRKERELDFSSGRVRPMSLVTCS
jgi:hypothetical protein